MSAQYRETPPASCPGANLRGMSESNPRPAPKTSPPVTIYDVAHRAGVSASTVSRAFSRPDRVSGRTAAAIRAAAEELGYGRTLDTRPKHDPATNTLGLVLADVANPFFQEVWRGAEHAARVGDMAVLTADVQESVPRTHAAIERMIPLVDGLILASTRLSGGETQKIARRVPTVSVNRPVPGVPSVLVDDYDGMVRVTAHLHDQGARSITYLSGPADSWSDAVRWRALLDVAGNTDPADRPAVLTRAAALSAERARKLTRMTVRQRQVDQPTIRGGRRAFEVWRTQPTDAVICFNDLVAVGFLDQARRAGVTAPEDLLIVGFDNTDLAGVHRPSLTTVAGPLRAVGRVAAANVMALARGLDSPLSKPRVLPARLIVRESSTRAG